MAAPTFVQRKDNFNGGSADFSIGAFVSNITAGNLIIGHLKWDDTTNTLNSISDTLGNTYTLLDNPTTHGSIANVSTAQFYAKSPTGGANTVTAHFSGTVNNCFSNVEEIAGHDTTTPIDQHNILGLPNPGTGTDAVAGTPVTTTRNDEFIYGGTQGKFNSTCTTQGTGYGNQLLSAVNVEDKTLATAGSATVTFTGPADDWFIFTMTVQPPGSAASAPLFRGS